MLKLAWVLTDPLLSVFALPPYVLRADACADIGRVGAGGGVGCCGDDDGVDWE